MIIQYPHNRFPSAMNFTSYGMFKAAIGFTTEVTLADLLACCEANAVLITQVLKKLNLRGFKRDKPSRKDLSSQIQQVANELIDFKRLIRRRDEFPGGGNNGLTK